MGFKSPLVWGGGRIICAGKMFSPKSGAIELDAIGALAPARELRITVLVECFQ